ncbi:MAG: hypothetical protein HY661_14690 [Betaproteobacteria bacterium]|nr:hypothetical protein [Betaproteobacteria bacterium]
MSPEQSYGYLNRLVNQQAFTIAAFDRIQTSAILLVLPVPLIWVARPARKPGGYSGAR